MRFFIPFFDLTKFERILWLFSVFITITSSLCSPKLNFLTVIASLIGVTALIFVAKGYILGQLLTVVFAVFYGIISFFFRYYGEMITYLFMTAPIAIFSVITWWKHPYEGTRVVTIQRLRSKHWFFLFLSAILITAVFYFILSALGNANLLFSTISITTSYIASLLTLLRSPYYALGYAANDIVLILLWILATMEDISYLPMILCFLLFFVNDLYGFYNWRQMEHRQKSSLPPS